MLEGRNSGLFLELHEALDVWRPFLSDFRLEYDVIVNPLV